MTLQEFLNTAPEDHHLALEAANSYSETTGQLIDATTVNGALTDFKLITVLKDVSENNTHPARDICLGVYTGLLGNHPFNLMQNSFTGQRALAQLNWLIETGLPEHATALSQFRDLMLWRANIVSYPFANVTLHDVLILRDVCPSKPVTSDTGWVTITTTADCPLHNPRLLAYNDRTGKWQWVTNFREVKNAGIYECQVPREWFGSQLKVDDPYEAIA